MTKPTVFISYSHKDEQWKDRLVTHLGVLQSQGLLDLWDDRRIGSGEDWYQEIQEAMAAASVAVLLVTANFLTSQFILSKEVPRLLGRRDKEGLRIFPVIVKPCAWKRVKWLARMQCRPKDGRPLSAGDEHQIDADLAAIAEEIAVIIDQDARVTILEGVAPIDTETATSARQRDEMPKLPEILLDFTSAQSLQDWEVEEDNDLLTLEYDTELGMRVLVKKGHKFEPSVTSPPFDCRLPHYEIAVRLNPESYFYIHVLDKTGKYRILAYSSAAILGLNRYGEFAVPLSKDISDGNWHSLMINLPKHMEQAHWSGFAKVNRLSLRREVALAGVRGCDDEDSLMKYAIAPPYVVSHEAKPLPSPEVNGEMTRVDFVIITALEKEAKAVVSRLENYSIKRFEDRDIRTYHCGTIPIQNTDRAYRVVVVLLPSMGEISAATAVTDAITCWNPRFVLIVGIAGGIPQDDLDLGDVVVADQIVGYDYGKITDHGIQPRDRVYPASALLLDRVRSFWDDSWTQQVNVPRPDNATRAVSKPFVGPIASGNKVITSTEFRQQLKTRWPKLVAVEMEAEGVFAAVFDRPQIRATLVIRGICDMADERKSDEWQEYAANAAAAFTVCFLRSGPVEPRATTPAVPAPVGPSKTSTSRLPPTGQDLFGRQAKLELLDQAWADPGTNVLSLVAWGGVGKSALVNHWLRGMAGDHYRGAERVYAWSFYSQGTTERAVSADLFIELALTWFGDPDPNQGSPWDKGERLARLVKGQRTLLVLDGLEPLQFPPGQEEGRLKDQALQALLRELAALNPGLCVISTRLPVTDLEQFQENTAWRINLEHLSPQAGAEILRAQGVKDGQAELEQAARDFGGHALALTLLGSLLRDAYDGDIRCQSEVGPLAEDVRHGGHAQRVMASYEKWFGEGPELAVLRMLGLFNRPADGPAVAALRAAPAIPGLTDKLQDLSERDWRLALAKLRRAMLLAERDQAQPDTLDAHPLVREHFGQQLQDEYPDAWREGNNRLYEHLKDTTKEYPDTIEEIAPLYAAVAHGCQAGRHQEALDDVYRRRIQRGNESFNTHKLGALGAELATLSSFLDPPWRQAVAGLSDVSKGFVLNEAGFDLRALGRLAEAAQPMQAGLDASIALKDWKNAAVAANNLSELYLTSGDLAQALDYAQQSVDLADQGGAEFDRMDHRTVRADALHQVGRLPEAETAFREAEEMQKARQPELPLLYSLVGFRYCDLLLGQGKCQEVQSRAGQTLEWAKQAGGSLLTIALDYLSLGRAHLLQAQQEGSHDFSQAVVHLERAMDGLRQAGHQEDLSRGLLARAELRRVMDDMARARRDLEEVLSIATRGGMRLHEADCHLEYAQLYLACGEKEKGRESLARAKEMIEEMGYHRRDGEVVELERELESLKH